MDETTLGGIVIVGGGIVITLVSVMVSKVLCKKEIAKALLVQGAMKEQPLQNQPTKEPTEEEVKAAIFGSKLPEEKPVEAVEEVVQKVVVDPDDEEPEETEPEETPEVEAEVEPEEEKEEEVTEKKKEKEIDGYKIKAFCNNCKWNDNIVFKKGEKANLKKTECPRCGLVGELIPDST